MRADELDQCRLPRKIEGDHKTVIAPCNFESHWLARERFKLTVACSQFGNNGTDGAGKLPIEARAD